MPRIRRQTTAALLLLVAIALTAPLAPARQEERKPDHARVVYVVRHAEAEKDAGRDPDLTAEGVARAERLAHALSDEKLFAVFVTPTRRSAQTGAPVAKAADLETTTYDPFDTDGLRAQIDALRPGATSLVIAHSNTTPMIVRALAGDASPPGLKDLWHDEHDPLYAVILNENDPARVLQLRYSDPAP